MPEKGIIPGVSLSLSEDLGRRLPSGKYKLTGTLYVDGRRLRPMEKEVDFEGDPAVTRLAVDTALMLDPPELLIESAPGATRTAVINVENASEEAVQIQADAVIPPPLQGVALGELKGKDLSCAPWVQVSPGRFTLGAGRSQNVRVVARMPKEDGMHANYYAVLSFNASYADGQSAGRTATFVCVTNRAVETVPKAEITRLALSADEGSKYVIQVQTANVGNVHFMPKMMASLINTRGNEVLQRSLGDEAEVMLPLETRRHSGVLDFAEVPAGTYALRALLDYASGEAVAEQLVVNVADKDNQKVVSVVPLHASTRPHGGDDANAPSTRSSADPSVQ